MPISIDGDDDGSGVNKNSRHIFLDSGYYTQLDNGDGTYNVGNTNKNGQEYYATIEDNVGNKATCSQIYYVDTELPTCKVNPVSKNEPVNGWYNISSTNSIELGILLSKLDNVDISDYGLTTSSTVTYNKTGEGTQNDTDNTGVNWYGYVKDYAGNTNSCSANFKVDIHAPTIEKFYLSSSSSKFNVLDPTININVYDHINGKEQNNNIKYGFSSATPIADAARKYTKQGSTTIKFSELDPNRIDDFNGSTSAGYNGATYTTYVSALDEAGNETISSANYTVYKDCSSQYSYQGDWGACSNDYNCVQYASEVYKDSNTGTKCNEVANEYSQECNDTTFCTDDDDIDDSTSTSINCPSITADVNDKTWTNKKNVNITIDFSQATNYVDYTYFTKGDIKDENPQSYKSRNKSLAKVDKNNNQKYTISLGGEGKRRLKIQLKGYDNSIKNCYSDNYYIDRTAPTVSKGSFSRVACNSQTTTNYLKFKISDSLSGLKKGEFNWSTTDKVNAGNTTARSGKTHTECIATSAGDENKLNLSYNVCDKAGNCNTSKNWK